MTLASTWKHSQNKNSIGSFKLQLSGGLACPWTRKQASLSHREAYIKGSGWGLLHPEHIQHTTFRPINKSRKSLISQHEACLHRSMSERSSTNLPHQSRGWNRQRPCQTHTWCLQEASHASMPLPVTLEVYVSTIPKHSGQHPWPDPQQKSSSDKPVPQEIAKTLHWQITCTIKYLS
jgi:hypothetical protein